MNKYIVTAFCYDAFSGIFSKREFVFSSSIDEALKEFKKNNSQIWHVLKVEQSV